MIPKRTSRTSRCSSAGNRALFRTRRYGLGGHLSKSNVHFILMEIPYCIFSRYTLQNTKVFSLSLASFRNSFTDSSIVSEHFHRLTSPELSMFWLGAGKFPPSLRMLPRSTMLVFGKILDQTAGLRRAVLIILRVVVASHKTIYLATIGWGGHFDGSDWWNDPLSYRSNRSLSPTWK